MRLQWLVAITMVLGTFAVGQNKFPMTCHPFQAIEVQHPIDSSCGLTGTGKGGSALQNQTKNNFCAGTTYQAITQQDILSKQTKVAALPGYLQWDQENMPTSRADFVSLGEGTAVQFIGYVVEAHYADLTSGESVNCEVKDDEASNDIHIALAPQPGVTNQCLSNSAEMIPHYRPASWNVTYLQKIGNSTLVRVSGQLMYDADHKICGEQGFSASDNPSRLSGWEIHPVYNFEVCAQQSGGTCSQWVALSDWAASASSKSKTAKTKSGSHRSTGSTASQN
ncbi:MAG: hypothetical protein ACLPPV_04230 [Candidatus Korobacteraceae bacterium]|jgi:hypothetical protein